MSKLSEFQDRLNKKFGTSMIMSMEDAPEKVDVISTGSILLDRATGIGGVPCGRLTELFGTESSGKTTIALQIVANAQKMGKPCVYLDVEQSLDLDYAKALGVIDSRDLFVFGQPNCGEEVIDITREAIEGGGAGIVVVDSVAQMSPRVELEGEISDANMGSHARLMGKAMRIIARSANIHNCCVVMINQERSTMSQYAPTTTPGGKALKYAASMRIRMQGLSEKFGEVGSQTAQTFKATVQKNKLAPPFRTADLRIKYGQGVVLEQEMVSVGIDVGLWDRKGAWYVIDDETKFHGTENLIAYLSSLHEENPDKFATFLEACRSGTP